MEIIFCNLQLYYQDTRLLPPIDHTQPNTLQQKPSLYAKQTTSAITAPMLGQEPEVGILSGSINLFCASCIFSCISCICSQIFVCDQHLEKINFKDLAIPILNCCHYPCYLDSVKIVMMSL